jgi:hypothetical protein
MKLPTYAESQGVKNFNWFNFLTKPSITQIEWEEARVRAQSWVTCACGNQCAAIERDGDGQPEDLVLQTIGGKKGFFGAIKDKDVDAALHFLRLIEMQSGWLLQQKREAVIKETNKLFKEALAMGISVDELIRGVE